jgi:hypothetical protein
MRSVGAWLAAPKPALVAVPDGLTLKHHRDLEGRERRPRARRGLIGALAGILVLGLFNVFGQHVSVDAAELPAARFEVSAPDDLRGGLFFEARYSIEAVEEIENATIVLDQSWLEDITLNTVEPAPVGESSRDGDIAFELGRIPAGDEYHFYLHFQVNPTALGSRSQNVALYDGEELLASFERDAFVWP